MQLLPLLVATLLGISALAFVLYPLYSLYRRTPVETQKVISQSEQLSSDVQADLEQTARTTLQEIELDYQLGNLTEPDYRSLRERYLRRAFLAMKFRHNHDQQLDELIEEQLRRMKEGKGVEGHDEE